MQNGGLCKNYKFEVVICKFVPGIPLLGIPGTNQFLRVLCASAVIGFTIVQVEHISGNPYKSTPGVAVRKDRTCRKTESSTASPPERSP